MARSFGNLVKLETQGPLFILHLGEKENRFTTAFVKALNEALDHIVAARPDGEPAALVTVSSDDKIYSNGLDLSLALKTGPEYFYAYQRLLVKLLTFPIPTVACLNGHAFAGGCMFAMAHDFRVMRSDRGYICMNEVDIPGPLSPGMHALLNAKIPPGTPIRVLLMPRCPD
jgi:enoyl-CoA hydratase/carnithine racemase